MMTCERYWRDGVVLAEQGLPDLHREGCEVCQRAHAERGELVRAVGETGPRDEGRPDWQLRVWQQIAREEKRAGVRRGWWFAGGGLAVAGAVAVALYLGRERAPEPYKTVSVLEKGPVVKRGDAQVGDRVRTMLAPEDEVRIYRGGELVFRCAGGMAGPQCTHDKRGSVARFELPSAGDYTIVIVTRGAVEPVGSFDRDMAALVQANVAYRIEQELAVR
jgi:hypothetical protein